MNYQFGPDKKNFNGTQTQWNKFKEEIAWWNEDTSSYPVVNVVCPHCGSINTHNIFRKTSYDDLKQPLPQENHRECDLMTSYQGNMIPYNCPGYSVCHWIGDDCPGMELLSRFQSKTVGTQTTK